MPDVFISHSAKDKLAADAACAVLEQHRVRCWIAPRDIPAGAEWAEGIMIGLESCPVMVVVFSRHANESPQVRREVERAVAKGLIIIPFRIEDVLPTKAMEFFISTAHWLDAFTPPLQIHLEHLATTILGFLRTESGPARGVPVATSAFPVADNTQRPAKPWLSGVIHWARSQSAPILSHLRRYIAIIAFCAALVLGVAGFLISRHHPPEDGLKNGAASNPAVQHNEQTPAPVVAAPPSTPATSVLTGTAAPATIPQDGSLSGNLDLAHAPIPSTQDPIIGEWDGHNTKAGRWKFSVLPDGRTYQANRSEQYGTWHFLRQEGAKRVYVLEWQGPQFTDTLALDETAMTLEGKNNKAEDLQADRIGPVRVTPSKPSGKE